MTRRSFLRKLSTLAALAACGGAVYPGSPALKLREDLALLVGSQSYEMLAKLPGFVSSVAQSFDHLAFVGTLHELKCYRCPYSAADELMLVGKACSEPAGEVYVKCLLPASSPVI